MTALITIADTEILTPGIVNDFIKYLDRSERTTQEYFKNIKYFCEWCQVQGIKRPTRNNILEYKAGLKARGLKSTTIQAYLQALSVFFSWLEFEGIYTNIYKRIAREKLTRSPKKDALTLEQAQAVLKAAKDRSPRDYAIMRLLLGCGLRTIEIIQANKSDIRNITNNTCIMLQGKGRTDKSDFVPVPAKALEAINDYLKTRKDKSDVLFISTSNRNAGERLTTKSIRRIVKDILTAAGIVSPMITAHSTRHTAVTMALLNGLTLQEVQQFARHGSPATTLIYAHNLNQAANGCGAAIEKMLG